MPPSPSRNNRDETEGVYETRTPDCTLQSYLNVQVSDTRNDDSSNAAG